MSISNISDLPMSHFNQQRRKPFGSSSSLNFSWPLESGRNTPIQSSHHSEFSTRPTTPRTRPSTDQQSLAGFSWYSDSSSSADPSDVLTRRESHSSECSDYACEYPCMEPSIVSPDKPPSESALDLAGEVEVFDGNGQSRTFKSLYSGSDAMGEQQLIIFVRHFFCPDCQAYLKLIHQSISMKQYFSLPVPTSITIIGLGDPNLIPAFRKFSGTKFPIFTDPSRRLHRLLGMSWSLNLGRKNEYSETNVIQNLVTISKQTATLPEAQKAVKDKGGAFWWLGGEFLIRDGKVIWCHRMKTYRDHIEMKVLKELLGVDSA